MMACNERGALLTHYRRMKNERLHVLFKVCRSGKIDVFMCIVTCGKYFLTIPVTHAFNEAKPRVQLFRLYLYAYCPSVPLIEQPFTNP